MSIHFVTSHASANPSVFCMPAETTDLGALQMFCHGVELESKEVVSDVWIDVDRITGLPGPLLGWIFTLSQRVHRQGFYVHLIRATPHLRWQLRSVYPLAEVAKCIGLLIHRNKPRREV